MGAPTLAPMARSARIRRLAGFDAAVHVLPGPPGARAFVLVHGIGVSARTFLPVALTLARYGTVYAIDLPGYGASPRPPRDAALAEHGAVVAEFVRSRGLVRPVLVGHSMGAQIVTQLAVDDPALTDRLVLIGTTMPPRLRTVPRAIAALIADVPREPPHLGLIVTVDYLLRCGIPYFIQQLPELIEDAIEDRLPDVHAKTLVIAGENDPIAGNGWSQFVADRLADGRFVEVAGAHGTMYSDPDRLARLIVEHSR